MKKLIVASLSGFALLGLAACSDTDGTTTQSLPAEEPTMEQPAAPATPPAEPAAPEAPAAPAE